MRFVCQTVWLFIFTLLLHGCKTLNAPRPISSEALIEFEPLLSYVRVPVSIPLKSINELINTQMGSLVYEDRSYTQPSADDYQLIVLRRASVSSVFEGGDLKITIPLNIWGKAQWKACSICPSIEKETRFDVDVFVRSTPEIGLDYAFKLNLKSDGFEWKSKPVLSIGPIDIPIERVLQKQLEKQLELTVREVEQEIASSFDLRAELNRLWRKAAEPMLLDAESQTWLSIRPEQVYLSSLTAANGNLNLVLGASAFVSTVSGLKPSASPAKPLPVLQKLQKLPDDFRVQVQCAVSYEALNAQVKKNLVGKSFSQGRKQIKIEDMFIGSEGNRLLVQVLFSGSAKGNVFLSGIPAYDADKGDLYFNDVDLDIQSRNILLKSAGWLLNTSLQSVISSQLRYPIGASIKETKDELSEKIKSFGEKGIYQVNGAVNAFDLQGIYLKPEGLLIVLDAKGRVDLKIEKLSF